MNSARREHLTRFYAALEHLETRMGGSRTLATATGRSSWPSRGVYFFRESGEQRSETGIGPRIVRVGTHALKAGSGTTLWARLSQHKGSTRTGAGNHRGSVFRLLLGNALIHRGHYNYPTWGKGSSACRDTRAGETPLEAEVSRILGDMPFLWLAIEDESGPASLRGRIERNSIALLSNAGKAPLDASSMQWLGLHCDRERVRRSGLWNSNHVEEPYDPAFLDDLERLVADARIEA